MAPTGARGPNQDQRAEAHFSAGGQPAPGVRFFHSRVVLRGVAHAQRAAIQAQQAQAGKETVVMPARVGQRAQGVAHHAGERLETELGAAGPEDGGGEVHAEECAKARGQAAMKLHLLGDQPDDELPLPDLLPRSLMAAFVSDHERVKLRAKNFTDAGDEMAILRMRGLKHPLLLSIRNRKYSAY